MRGGPWLCLVVLVLLVPLAAADHKDRPLIRIGWDDRDEDWDKDRDKERDEKRDEKRDDDERRRADDNEDESRRDGETSSPWDGSPGCLAPSGGATENGNVVAWEAQDVNVTIHRRVADDGWQEVHTAAAGDGVFVDHDLQKGRSYAYRVAHEGAQPGPCPMLEMEAVPFFGSWSAWAATGLAGVAWVVWRR